MQLLCKLFQLYIVFAGQQGRNGGDSAEDLAAGDGVPAPHGRGGHLRPPHQHEALIFRGGAANAATAATATAGMPFSFVLHKRLLTKSNIIICKRNGNRHLKCHLIWKQEKPVAADFCKKSKPAFLSFS